MTRDHGRTKYLIERCRCDICTAANADHSRRYRQQRAQQRVQQSSLQTQPVLDDKWRHQAACKTHPSRWWFDDEHNQFATAKAICKLCPVRTECLSYAMSLDNMHGIWGGTTVYERRNLKKRLQAQ